jgi:hypothetical protein
MSLEGMHQMKRIERFLELLIFNSRWLLAPFYIGLVAAIAMLLVKFLQGNRSDPRVEMGAGQRS